MDGFLNRNYNAKIPCATRREIETLKKKALILFIRRREIYIEDKESIWVTTQ